jgi:hypothetical protein
VGLNCVTLSLGSCSPPPIIAITNPIHETESGYLISTGGDEPGFNPAQLSIGSNAPSQDGMIEFDGSVFVAAAGLVSSRWLAAGWIISEQPVNTDTEQVPSDCTLYPHQGVPDQWVGNCTVLIRIPEDGASHISVMHTGQDGTTTMVQIAPPPDGSQP